MKIRLIVFALVLAATLSQPSLAEEDSRHIVFGLVRGSAGFVSSDPHGMMTDAPYTVLAFTGKDRHRSLVLTDYAGDYTAVLPPGHYCLSAYLVKNGDVMQLDPRQLKCIDLLVGQDVRLDVMLIKPKDESLLPRPPAKKLETPSPKS
jgi:hypothetical protein